MRHVEFVVILDDGVRKRHIHDIEKGRLIYFAVQLETKIDKEWRTVIRYDNAHGKAHIDKYYRNGRKEKINLDMDFKTVLNLGDWDISINWEKYINNYKGI